MAVTAALLISGLVWLAYESRNFHSPPDLPPLHLAAMRKNPAEVRRLLQAGEDPNQTDQYGLPALYYALPTDEGVQDYTVARILIDGGADVNPRDPGGVSLQEQLSSMGGSSRALRWLRAHSKP